MPARNIVVVCSGSHEKKVNLGEVFQYSVPIAVEIRMPARNIVVVCSDLTRRRSTLVRFFGEVFRVRSFGRATSWSSVADLTRRRSTLVRSFPNLGEVFPTRRRSTLVRSFLRSFLVFPDQPHSRIWRRGCRPSLRGLVGAALSPYTRSRSCSVVCRMAEVAVTTTLAAQQGTSSFLHNSAFLYQLHGAHSHATVELAGRAVAPRAAVVIDATVAVDEAPVAVVLDAESRHWQTRCPRSPSLGNTRRKKPM